jgi:hypothetical protein
MSTTSAERDTDYNPIPDAGRIPQVERPVEFVAALTSVLGRLSRK